MTGRSAAANLPDMRLSGAAVKQARQARELSQTALARLADTSVDTVRRIENDRIEGPSAVAVARIAHALRVPMDSLFTSEEGVPVA